MNPKPVSVFLQGPLKSMIDLKFYKGIDFSRSEEEYLFGLTLSQSTDSILKDVILKRGLFPL